MAITIEISCFNGDKRTIQKTTTNTTTVDNVYVKEPCSLMAPVFVLDTNTNYFTRNYVKAWDRYYYINDIVLAPGAKMELHCSEDVLMTFADDILDSSFILEYSSLNESDSYLVHEGDVYKQYTEEWVQNFNFNFQDQTNTAQLFVLVK